MTCAKVENGKSDAQQSVIFKKVRKPKYDAYDIVKTCKMLPFKSCCPTLAYTTPVALLVVSLIHLTKFARFDIV